MKYWWLNTDPAKWNIFTKLKVGCVEQWDARSDSGKLKRHMKAVRKGDVALCYQTHKASVLVAELAAEGSLYNHSVLGDCVPFRLRRFLPPISWEVIRRSRVFSVGRQRMLRRTTLEPLEQEQYERLLQIAAKPSLAMDPDARDDEDHDQLIAHEQNRDLEAIRAELRSLQPSDPVTVEIFGKIYRRDEKTIAQLKLLRNFKCQICGTRIAKKNGKFYVEAAHLTAKCRKGPELPENIIILCPNHHKEFDFGQLCIGDRSKNSINFTLNGNSYAIDLVI